MFRSVFLKTVYDKRWFVFGWSLGVMAMLGFTAAFFPTFRDSGLDEIMKTIPPALKSMLGEMSEYGNFPGYVASAVYGLRAQMLFIPLAIILGYSLGVSDEASARLYQLLAQPISRRRVLLEKYAAGLVVLAVIVVLCALAVGTVAVFLNEPVPVELLSKISAMTMMFATAIYTLTYGLGKAFGRKSIALFVPLIWVMFSILSDAFSSQVDWLQGADYVSVLRYYSTSDLLHDPIDVINVAVLGGASLVVILAALIGFPARDLHEEVS
jgi:ABC-2 type transport system permease protein